MRLAGQFEMQVTGQIHANTQNFTWAKVQAAKLKLFFLRKFHSGGITYGAKLPEMNAKTNRDENGFTLGDLAKCGESLYISITTAMIGSTMCSSRRYTRAKAMDSSRASAVGAHARTKTSADRPATENFSTRLRIPRAMKDSIF